MHNKTTKLRFYTEAFLFTPRETGESVRNNFFAVAQKFSRPCLGNDHYCGRLRACGFRLSCPRLTKKNRRVVCSFSYSADVLGYLELLNNSTDIRLKVSEFVQFYNFELPVQSVKNLEYITM